MKRVKNKQMPTGRGDGKTLIVLKRCARLVFPETNVVNLPAGKNVCVYLYYIYIYRARIK